jgi:prepilin-type N-terminal cleavage/methylation domain-containing protein
MSINNPIRLQPAYLETNMTCQTSHPITRQLALRASKPRRAGFTLVEILVVIAIIGILIGALAYGLVPALRRAQSATVQMEITQIGQALESFKTKYGFYPPSGERFERDVSSGGNYTTITAEASQILPYLNRIAPNHRELEPSPLGNGNTRLEDWWIAVGSKLNQQTSMIFWLSGLAESSQYPLTGGIPVPVGASAPADYIPCGYNENKYVGFDVVNSEVVERPLNDGTAAANPIVLIRNVFYDFQSNQVIEMADATTTPASPLGVARYVGRYGAGEHAFGYRDAASYIPYVLPQDPAPSDQMPPTTYVVDPTYPDGSFPGFAYHIEADGDLNTFTSKNFAAPNTFQIITVGMDGDSGRPEFALETGEIMMQAQSSADNLCSFADGPLSAFETGQLR